MWIGVAKLKPTKPVACLELIRNLKFFGVEADDDVNKHHNADSGKDGKVGYHNSNL